MKYYAVRRGREPGIYGTWTECQAQIFKFSGAVFKSFEDLDAAQEYLNRPDVGPIDSTLPFAYIDGSFSAGVYGYGGFLSTGGQVHIIQGVGSNPDYLPERNIAGECLGALKVMQTAQEHGVTEFNLFFDYTGVENWPVGSWTARTPLAIYYTETARELAQHIRVHYVRVSGHSGIIGNEVADLLAKEATGAHLRKIDVETLAAFRAGTLAPDAAGKH